MTPKKYFINFSTGNIVSQEGGIIASPSQLPSCSLGEKPTINFQLVEDDMEECERLVATVTGRMLVDSDYANEPIPVPLGSDGWSSTTGDEYAIRLLYEPTSVYFDEVAAVEGTVGSLSAGQYAYDSTESMLHVHLADSNSPAMKDDDFVEIYLPQEVATPPFIDCDSDNFNQSLTWYDTVTETMRDPDITKGEITFQYNANTANYYIRIGSREKIDCTCEIQLRDSSEVLFSVIKIPFICKNRISAGEAVPLDLSSIRYYTATECDENFVAKDDRPIGATTLSPEVGDTTAVWTIDSEHSHFFVTLNTAKENIIEVSDARNDAPFDIIISGNGTETVTFDSDLVIDNPKPLGTKVWLSFIPNASSGWLGLQYNKEA